MEGARLLTVKEVCVYLFGDYNRSLRHRVYALLDANDVPKIKDGKQYYVARSAIENLLGGAG